MMEAPLPGEKPSEVEPTDWDDGQGFMDLMAMNTGG